ncbi:MAG: T9SS type A sorting domain-containing protein [Bacteroidetes bacterium]|nr:T9SS type A sorting domain-containing protein [Bacteroidota bacterium]
MKRVLNSFCFFLVYLILFSVNVQSQVIYKYTLSNSFSGSGGGAPDLIQIPNNSGLTGDFVTRTVPVTTCEQGGDAKGYFFEDDAGLQFNSPNGFIDNQYSLSMIFQFDEFISPPSWVRVLSFTHIDDHGIYIKLTNPPLNGTLEFWPNGTVGTIDFFNTADFYQLILVRQTDNLVKIFINGSEFDTYDDAVTMEYIPHPPDNFLIFFRDHPSVLANEASPGFVSNIEITNIAWTPQEIQAKWNEFCASLLSVPENQSKDWKIWPNPVSENLYLNLTYEDDGTLIRIFDVAGRLLYESVTSLRSPVVDVKRFDPGLYYLFVTQKGNKQTFRFSKQ